MAKMGIEQPADRWTSLAIFPRPPLPPTTSRRPGYGDDSSLTEQRDQFMSNRLLTAYVTPAAVVLMGILSQAAAQAPAAQTDEPVKLVPRMYPVADLIIPL